MHVRQTKAFYCENFSPLFLRVANKHITFSGSFCLAVVNHVCVKCASQNVGYLPPLLLLPINSPRSRSTEAVALLANLTSFSFSQSFSTLHSFTRSYHFTATRPRSVLRPSSFVKIMERNKQNDLMYSVLKLEKGEKTKVKENTNIHIYTCAYHTASRNTKI